MVDLFLLTLLAKWLLSLSEFEPVIWKVHLSCIVNSHSSYQTAEPEVSLFGWWTSLEGTLGPHNWESDTQGPCGCKRHWAAFIGTNGASPLMLLPVIVKQQWADAMEEKNSLQGNKNTKIIHFCQWILLNPTHWILKVGNPYMEYFTFTQVGSCLLWIHKLPHTFNFPLYFPLLAAFRAQPTCWKLSICTRVFEASCWNPNCSAAAAAAAAGSLSSCEGDESKENFSAEESHWCTCCNENAHQTRQAEEAETSLSTTHIHISLYFEFPLLWLFRLHCQCIHQTTPHT